MFGPSVELIDCQYLYNLLNEGIEHSLLNDPYYLYLLDCRSKSSYNESHILTARHVKRNDDNQNFLLPYEAELESRNIIVVYDGHTSSLQDSGDALECAKLIFESGSKNSVKILSGGYESFSRYYPFLRTQKIIYMPRELDELKTYPSEIISGLLYLGNLRHGTDLAIKKDLKLTSYIDCTGEDFKFKNEKSIDYIKIPIDDSPEESIKDYIEDVCNFLDTNIKNRKQPCLVYSDMGISRSAAFVIAYLVYSERLSTEEAFVRVSKCKRIQPQVCFLNQISEKFQRRSFINN